ncbi:hypothetical protein JTB14_013839 [Gonioctena quinquepunctata]|nr:hypothetical protein JTB14_013839 [Gonioctena quinquepunctata]
MKSTTLFVILFAFHVTVDAWVAIIPYDPSSNQTSHCYGTDPEVGEMKKGEEKRLASRCVKASCGSNRDIGLTGCGSVQVDPPCKVVEGNLSKPHPECCHEIKCPDDYPNFKASK